MPRAAADVQRSAIACGSMSSPLFALPSVSRMMRAIDAAAAPGSSESAPVAQPP